MRGEGEAKALTIYAQAYNLDPDFYYFTRTLEAYKKALDKNTTVVFSSDNEFFDYLKGEYGKKK